MLYAYMICKIIRPMVDWSAWGGNGLVEEEEEVKGRTRTAPQVRRTIRRQRNEMAYLALELPKERKWHRHMYCNQCKDNTWASDKKTHLLAESSASAR